MAASIPDALSSLLPTHNHQHPAKLTNLANSLLAQSRNKAPHLKAEEEIARPYVCADIACNRLRDSLRLDLVKGRPPCKPVVYRKLYAFLDGQLKEVGRKKQPPASSHATPQKRKIAASARGSANTKDPVTTPVKLPQTGTPAFAGSIESPVPLARNSTDDVAPSWVMPLVRKLCKAFDTPQMPPHVYTGVCVLMKLANLRVDPSAAETAKGEIGADISALLIATYLLVLTRMQKGEMTSEVYERICSKAIQMAQLDHTSTNQPSVAAWISRTNQEDWCQGQDWWHSVPEEVIERVGDDDNGVTRDEEDDILNAQRHPRRRRLQEDHEPNPEGALLPGLGTMMQDAVDWLSEDKKQKYLKWKDQMVKRIQETEQSTRRAVAVR